MVSSAMLLLFGQVNLSPQTFDNAVLFCTSKAMFQTDKNLWVLSIIIKRKLGTYLLFYCIFTDRAFVVTFKSLSCT